MEHFLFQAFYQHLCLYGEDPEVFGTLFKFAGHEVSLLRMVDIAEAARFARD